MKNCRPNDGVNCGRRDNSKGWVGSIHQKKKNMKRLGGGGLSLEAFANMKSNRNQYNPALIKKKREFYKNAKCISKYKKSLKQLNQQNDQSRPIRLKEDRAENWNFCAPGNNEVGGSSSYTRKNKSRGSQSLMKVYEKKREEEEEARREREAVVKAKNEEREKAMARRKTEKEKMLKRTSKGQPVMKYRIQHILDTLQGSSRS
ncbi:hypothetical protein SAY87_025170 [Trapa incisa]|uniref:rRNA-processing protein FYV7 n=1 Tax=Trapa incisa TaxID=236973 RepID=A0AAN7GS99_9MYRT|nr:hypothetical protein SAY87_025170 [Trapa incisa]